MFPFQLKGQTTVFLLFRVHTVEGIPVVTGFTVDKRFDTTASLEAVENVDAPTMTGRA